MASGFQRSYFVFYFIFSKTRLISSESWVEEGVGGVCICGVGEAMWLASHRQLDLGGPAGVRVLGCPEQR